MLAFCQPDTFVLSNQVVSEVKKGTLMAETLEVPENIIMSALHESQRLLVENIILISDLE